MYQIKSLKSRPLGQGMTEYIIIVALIACAAIGVYSLFGQTIRNQTSALANEIAGTDSSDAIEAAGAAADDAAEQADTPKGLSNYNEGNQPGGGGT